MEIETSNFVGIVGSNC